ncbi:hypothetical protein CHS0354_037339 [Potamilus streckersoni]|uniref:Uncharacterized protein n=1 Tax=Potamilus streckersoni TaxID=2493646 RepID=A0AAE0RM85_9BIVA|nr:hypothetical protein CHS0354_037339 [Potamilus streckersoni]
MSFLIIEEIFPRMKDALNNSVIADEIWLPDDEELVLVYCIWNIGPFYLVNDDLNIKHRAGYAKWVEWKIHTTSSKKHAYLNQEDRRDTSRKPNIGPEAIRNQLSGNEKMYPRWDNNNV